MEGGEVVMIDLDHGMNEKTSCNPNRPIPTNKFKTAKVINGHERDNKVTTWLCATQELHIRGLHTPHKKVDGLPTSMHLTSPGTTKHRASPRAFLVA
jgi:hypothetical protein